MPTNGPLRRHAQEIAGIWVTKLKEVPAHKKLNLIYLANGTFKATLGCQWTLTLCRSCPDFTEQEEGGVYQCFRTGQWPHIQCPGIQQLLICEQIIGGSTISAYRETPAPIAEKIRRVVQVWKERSVFPEVVLKQIESGLAGKWYWTYRGEHLADSLHL